MVSLNLEIKGVLPILNISLNINLSLAELKEQKKVKYNKSFQRKHYMPYTKCDLFTFF